jgi:hypothetical protein
MKKMYVMQALYMLIAFITPLKATNQPNNADAQWVIIGAGPAGISVVGLLLDLGIAPKTITWIDPQFNVGRLGESYSNVPSNTQTKYFVEFINCCKTFKEFDSPALEKLYAYDPEAEYQLNVIIDPLRDITNYLCTHVTTIKNSLQSLDFYDGLWHVGADNRIITAYNVVLATGSHPRASCYDCDATEIPLDTALDKTLLAEQLDPQDSVAVIGSAHSAILILKHLSELSVKRIINFYKRPLQYAIPNPTGIINEGEGGLKGVTARWALEVLEKNPPAHIIRLFNQPAALDAWLPICNKIIYAIGFERNELPSINGSTNMYSSYDGSSGIIAPRLFGIGIAFPEKLHDKDGNQQLGIGLNDFIEYAQRVLPLWMKRATVQLEIFKNLFVITPL